MVPLPYSRIWFREFVGCPLKQAYRCASSTSTRSHCVRTRPTAEYVLSLFSSPLVGIGGLSQGSGMSKHPTEANGQSAIEARRTAGSDLKRAVDAAVKSGPKHSAVKARRQARKEKGAA